jgi:hypothetical protein
LRIGQWNHQHRQQGHMLEITHLFYPPCFRFPYSI